VRSPGRPERNRAREWSAALASTLDDVADQVGVAARRLTEGWPDARGVEWADRLVGLRRTLEHEAAAALEFVRAVDRVPDDEDVPAPDADPYAAPTGPRLGGTDARRAGDGRGARIPRWDEPDPGAG
jgi:hypothetical protein